MRATVLRATLVFAASVALSCGDGSSPTGPLGLDTGAPAAEESGTVRASNTAPALRLKTQPEALPGDPYPEIQAGPAPATVRFNLCESSDAEQNLENPEQGDTLNWQFHFGDDETEAFDEDGTFNPHFEHFCRTEHTYEDGTYVATVSVTDKHLEDQSGDVAAAARTTQRVTIHVGDRTFGQTVTYQGTLEGETNPADYYRIFMHEGDGVTIDHQCVAPGPLDPELQVRGPGGFFANNDDGGSPSCVQGSSSRIAFTAALDGVYTIEAGSFEVISDNDPTDVNADGPYRLVISGEFRVIE